MSQKSSTFAAAKVGMKRTMVIGWMLIAAVMVGQAQDMTEETPLVELCVYNDTAANDTSYFSDFAKAMTAANKAKRVSMRLLGDVSYQGAARAQTVKTNLTLDLNGYRYGDTLCSNPNTANLFYLNTDTVTFRITSSRPGGRLWAVRDYNGRIYALSANQGQIELNHLTIEVTNIGDATQPNAAASGVGIWTKARMEMSDCMVRVQGNAVSGVSTSGNKESAAQVTVRRTQIEAHGQKNSYGMSLYGAAQLSDCSVDVNVSGNNAYGIYINAYDTALHRAAHATIMNTRVRVLAGQRAYGIYSRWHLDMQRNTVKAETGLDAAYGFISYNDTTVYTAQHCSFTTEAGTITSYAAYNQKGRFEAEHCSMIGLCRQDTATQMASVSTRAVATGANSTSVLRHCSLTARAHPLYSRYVHTYSGNATGRQIIEDCVIEAEGAEYTYGLACNSQLHMSNCRIQARSWGKYSYGISINNYKDPDTQEDAKAFIERTRIRTDALTNAYAVSSRAPIELVRDTTNSKSDQQYSLGLYAQNDSAHYTVTHCSFTSEAGYNYAYGAYIIRGHLNAADSYFSATSHQDTAKNKLADCFTRGVAMSDYSSAKLSRCTLIAKATNELVSQNAYALNITNNSDTIRAEDCKLWAQSSIKYAAINLATNAVGRVFLRNGYYTHDTNLRTYLQDDYSIYRLYDEPEYKAGYRYTVRPIDRPNAVVARIYETKGGKLVGNYKSLPDALWFTYFNEDKDYTIVLIGDCRLSWGTYLLPRHVTLVVSHKEDQNAAYGIYAKRTANTTYTNPQPYVRLWLSDDAEMIVEGVLEVSAVQQAGYTVCGTVSAENGYGQIILAPTATISIENGARLQAWGYITGQGTIHAKAGSAVYEFMQLGGWKGGSVTYELINNKQRIFPITHFFYQNIESPIVYHAGCKAYGSTAAKISDFMVSYDGIRLIDDGQALFVMDSTAGANATICKAYDPLTDRTTWTSNGNITLDEMIIQFNTGLSNMSLVSSKYVLPMNTNYTIRAESGTLLLKHDISLMPGSEVEITPYARLIVPENRHLYVYDSEQFGFYRDEHSTVIPYSPSWKTCPRDTNLTDARMVVGGTVQVDGALYTTAGGAEIAGTDTVEGQIIFTHGAAPDDVVYQLTGTYDNRQYTAWPVTNAQLLNADSTYTRTINALPGAVYTYADGMWFSPDTVVEDTIPVNPPDTIEGLHQAQYLRTSRKIMHNNTIYICTPDGKLYNLLGVPIKKEEE